MTIILRLRTLWDAADTIARLETELAEANLQLGGLSSAVGDLTETVKCLPDADDCVTERTLDDRLEDLPSQRDFDDLKEEFEQHTGDDDAHDLDDLRRDFVESDDFETLGERVDALKERLDVLQTLAAHALAVIAKTLHIRTYLHAADPKALAQVDAALATVLPVPEIEQ